MTKIILLLLLFCAGCHMPIQAPSVQPMLPGATILWKTIMSTDWLMSIFMIAIVCGVFAGLNGMKSGWAGAFSCFLGLLLKAALSNTWVYLAAGFGLVGCSLLLVASILWKNKALVEIIRGVQNLKEFIPKTIVSEHENITPNQILSEGIQSRSTEKLVQQIKGNLKVRGEI